MNLYIETENGVTKNHPAFEENLRLAFGEIPAHWEPFTRVERPVLGVYQLMDPNEAVYTKVDGVWTDVWTVREMTAEEKHLVDVPAQYKNPDGSEMTVEQKAAVDVANVAAREAAKPVMQKTLENMYITYLTNQWTGVLREAGLIGASDVVNVENTDALQNMQYLMYFRAIGSTNVYDYCSNEFGRFKNSLKDYYGADLADCKWHPEIVDNKGAIKSAIKGEIKRKK